MLAGVVGVGQKLRAKLEQALLEKSELRLVHVFLVRRFQKILLAQLPLLLDLFRGTLRGHGFGSGGFAADAFGRDIFGCYTFGCHAITFLQRVFLLNFPTTLFGGAGRNRSSAHFAAHLPGPKFDPPPAASSRALYLEWGVASPRLINRRYGRQRPQCAPYNAKKQAVCMTFP